MKLLHLGLVLLAALLAPGCVGTIHPNQDTGESRIGRGDVIAVRLDPASASRVENLWGPFGQEKITVHTGEVIRKVFLGYLDGQPTFRVTDSKLSESGGGAGFIIRRTYVLHGVLTVDGKESPVTGTGTRAASMNGPSALRQAIELAAVDAAQQCRRIIETNHPE
jgi:hypothetical protein